MDVVVLARAELIALWAIAFLLPPLAQLAAHGVGRRLGVPPPRPLPRILLLTVASAATLLWLTGSRFASVNIGEERITVRYAPPLARTYSVPLERIETVSLRESRFPRRSYAVRIECADGREFRSVGVTPARLAPLYEIFEAFHPGEEPRVAWN